MICREDMSEITEMKELILMHSNDLHGDFLAEELDEGLLGGISMLSGYVNTVRNECENAVYCIACDMLQCVHTELYQYSGELQITFDKVAKSFTRFDFKGEPLLDNEVYTVALQEFHLSNFEHCFDFPVKELTVNGRSRILATSVHVVLIEHLPLLTNKDQKIEGIMTIV